MSNPLFDYDSATPSAPRVDPMFSKRAIFVALFAIVAILAVSAGGCTKNIQPDTAQQAVFETIALQYQTALDVAIAYDSLPPCEVEPHPPLCSTTATVKAIKAAKDQASPVVKAAEAAVRDPNFDQSKVQAAIVIAQQAVAALTAITNQLRTTP